MRRLILRPQPIKVESEKNEERRCARLFGLAVFCVRDKLFLPDISCEHLYDADWFSHENVHRFVIKPYNLDLNQLISYRDRILAMREGKVAAYKERMKRHFGKMEIRNFEGYGTAQSIYRQTA